MANLKAGLEELPQELINKSWPKRLLKIYRAKGDYIGKKLLQIINKYYKNY